MHRRLSFDANPKELASRQAGSTAVGLLWSRRTGRAAVVVEDGDSGRTLELEVDALENPLDVYEHALAYAPRRGRPGRS